MMRPASILLTLRIAAVLLVLGCIAAAPPPEPKFRPWLGQPTRGDYTVWVSDVHDGDSFTGCLLLPVKIRVMGINAPELSQAGGAAARDHLRKLIYGKQVDCRFYGTEKFGRTLGDVVIDGGWLSAAMIAAGQAKAYDGHGPRP